jgi:hypothetical protein
MGRAVRVHIVEEGALVDGVVFLQAVALVRVLNVAEVRVKGDVEGFCIGETLEGLVTGDFMCSGQLDRPLGDDVTVVLDGADQVMDTVDLLQVNGHYQSIRVFLFR